MTMSELLAALDAAADATVRIVFPDGTFVPAHFHVTEVGRVRKEFVDCGGTPRSAEACVLQTWVAHDTDHRLSAGKLAGIVRRSQRALRAGDHVVEIECQRDTIATYALAAAEAEGEGLALRLAAKHTACLAPDQCGVGDDACCTEPETAPQFVGLGTLAR
jgi:hypothetical protein